MADVQPNETYKGVPRVASTRIYTWDLTTGVNSLSDRAVQICMEGVRQYYIYFTSAGGVTAATIKPVAYHNADTSTGVNLNTAAGFLITGSFTVPCVGTICPVYMGVTLTSITSTADTTRMQLVLQY